VDVESYFVNLHHEGGEGAYRPSLLRGDDRCGHIMGRIGMSDRVMRKLELGSIPIITYQLLLNTRKT